MPKFVESREILLFFIFWNIYIQNFIFKMCWGNIFQCNVSKKFKSESLEKFQCGNYTGDSFLAGSSSSSLEGGGCLITNLEPPAIIRNALSEKWKPWSFVVGLGEGFLCLLHIIQRCQTLLTTFSGPWWLHWPSPKDYKHRNRHFPKQEMSLCQVGSQWLYWTCSTNNIKGKLSA